MANLEGITIDVTARVRDAQEGLEDVQEEALELSASLEAANASAERAEDSIEEAGDSASEAGRDFNRATVSIFGFQASLTTVVGVAALATPALVALSTAALGVAGAFGAIAGAFGALGLAAIVTNFSALKSEVQEAIPGIRSAIEPLGEVFTPVLLRAINALPDVFEKVVSAIQGAVDLEEFATTFERTIAILFRMLPPLAATMFEIAEAALPVLNDGLNWLRQNGGQAFGVISEATNELLPDLFAFGEAVVDLLPDLVDFGVIVLETLLPPLTALVEVLDDLLEFINSLPDGLVQAGLAAGGLAAILSKLGVIGGGGLLAGGLGSTGAIAGGGGLTGALAGGGLATLAGGALAVGVTTFLGASALGELLDDGRQDPRGPPDSGTETPPISEGEDVSDIRMVNGELREVQQPNNPFNTVTAMASGLPVVGGFFNPQEGRVRQGNRMVSVSQAQAAPNIKREQVSVRKMEIIANSREGGRQAGKGFREELEEWIDAGDSQNTTKGNK